MESALWNVEGIVAALDGRVVHGAGVASLEKRTMNTKDLWIVTCVHYMAEEMSLCSQSQIAAKCLGIRKPNFA